jgi:hypothetical protein
MKNNSHKLLIVTALLIVIKNSTFGQGSIPIIQHSGDADPTTEGFTLAQIGTQASVGPVVNNGVSAWNTTVSNVGNNISYVYSLTPQQQAETAGVDWILSFTVQDLQPGGIGNDFVIIGGAFGINLGSESNGDPYIGVIRSNPMFVLNGGGDGYHNYQIIYDAGTGTAGLWIDGHEEVDNFYKNISIPNGIPDIEWGESQAGPSSANWNLVSLEAVPEPSPIWLLFLGNGVLFYARCKHPKQPSVRHWT